MRRRAFLHRLPVLALTLVPGTETIALAGSEPTERAAFNVRRFGAWGNGQTKDT